MSGDVLTFTAAGELWAIPLRDVDEIVSVSEIRRLPLAPESVVGVIEIRGSAVVAVDFAKLVGHPPTAADSAIVVTADGCALALLVDTVRDVIDAEIEPRSTEPFAWSDGIVANATVINSTRLMRDAVFAMEEAG
jgi:purine-binding chemotaxis protein CheW